MHTSTGQGGLVVLPLVLYPSLTDIWLLLLLLLHIVTLGDIARCYAVVVNVRDEKTKNRERKPK
jgi:squalene cyclase